MLNLENVKYITYLDNTFCEMAKDYFCEKFNLNAFTNSCKSVKQIIADVNQNTLVVLPIENSVDGTVRETFESLISAENQSIKIIDEYCMPINYCLLSRTTEIYSISGIIAPPDVLVKCGEYIKNDMPFNVNVVEALSIADAAQSLQNYNLTYASVGSRKTAEDFNLNILKDNINDDKTNYTRYILAGGFQTEQSDFDTTCIAFTTQDKPGALLSVLEIFMKNKLNMSYIASYSSKNKFDEYVIVVNIDGHINNPLISETLNEVKEKTASMKFLGSYPKSKVLQQ